jgi:hypothetical protein
MATEAPNERYYPERVSLCPACGDQTRQRQWYWAIMDSEEDVQTPDGPERTLLTLYFHFAQCMTCGHPSVYRSVEEADFSNAEVLWPRPEIRDEQEAPEVRHLAAAAELLAVRGSSQAASLLVDCVGIRYVHLETLFRGDFDKVRAVRAVLFAEPLVAERLSGEVEAEILATLQEVCFGDEIWVQETWVVPVAAKGDWRARVEKTLGLEPTNQAVFLPPRAEPLMMDRLTFASEAEAKVYAVLREKHAEFPPHETIMIAPNPGVRIPGNTLSPDFLVSYRGRCGVIEVDGPHHRGRWANDKSRDALFEDAGAAYVLRISVEDTAENQGLRTIIDRFLKRLAPT